MSAPVFVRTQDVPSLPPPRLQRGLPGWLRDHLFRTPFDALVTAAALALILWAGAGVWDFFVQNATGRGTSRDDCLPNPGACYPYLAANLNFFVYGFYPEAERWRVNLTALIVAVALAAVLWPGFRYRTAAVICFFTVVPVTAVVLLLGGVGGLPRVETNQWGGMVVSFVVALTGIFTSLPLGVVLALGRRSRLPVVRGLSIAFIELWRGVPLVTVLFMASVMLPLFVPAGASPDKLLRALIGVSLFSAAYMAEVVRGGLQALPKGQEEAAHALGFRRWQTLALITLPQALKSVIPGIVNNFISLFKDTSLVFIVGLADFLKTVDMSLVNPNWATPSTRFTGYAFAALFYFLCCWGMSRYSQSMERRLATDLR